jgi:two-component SAPR family response regulator
MGALMTGDQPADIPRRRVLIAEDEYFVALDIAVTLKRRGVEVIGPASTVEHALTLIETASHLDAAVIDINLQGQLAFPIADVLERRGVPFIFTTGYDKSSLPEQYRTVPCCQKPVSVTTIAELLCI